MQHNAVGYIPLPTTMDIVNEITDYLASKDARITIYGTVLGMMVVFLTRRFLKMLKAWKAYAAKDSKNGFDNFLRWLAHHYKDCPAWLRALARSLEKLLRFFGVNLRSRTNYRWRKKQ